MECQLRPLTDVATMSLIDRSHGGLPNIDSRTAMT
jgi:hypothetical protein